MKRRGRVPGQLVHHYLLTKFNVAIDYARHKGQHVDRRWLSHRWSLFEQFCLPSVLGQTTSEFTWLIYCSNETPEPYRSHLNELAARHSRIEVAYLEGATSGEHFESWASVTGHPVAPFVLTSRLDNDDALSSGYMACVRKSALRYLTSSSDFSRGPHLWNFPVGYQYSKGKTYGRLDPRGPFLSLLEDSRSDNGIATVLSLSHREASLSIQTTQVWTRPAWLQVIHGENLANRIAGIRLLVNPASRIRFNPDIAPRETRLDAWGEVLESVGHYGLAGARSLIGGRLAVRRSGSH
jgi:hypothetical protein